LHFFSTIESYDVKGNEINDINYFINTVVLHFKWKPADLCGLFLDRQDMFGLLYWFDMIIAVKQEELKQYKKK